jgi:hypothetical protein
MRIYLTVSVICVLVLSGLLIIGNNNSANQDENNNPFTGQIFPIWYKTWGGKNSDMGSGIAIDSTYIYVCGSTSSYGVDGDALVLKYDINGNLIWNKTWSGKGFEQATSIAIDSTNVYVAGNTNYAVQYDAFILKYDFNGNLIWNREWGGDGLEYVYSIAVYGTNIYVAGKTNTYGAGGFDAFLLKYDGDGNLDWYKTWGKSGDDCAYSIAMNSMNIYLAGQTNSYGAGAYDSVILKYNMMGSLVWYKTWGGSNDDFGYGIAINNTNMYVVGETCSYGAGGDAFVLRYDLNGNLFWNQTWGGNGDDYGFNIKITSTSIYVTGKTKSNGTVTYDAFILRYDFNNSLVWDKTWGGSGEEYGLEIAVDSTNIYLVGFTSSYGAGYEDVFVLKANLDGGGGPIVTDFRFLFIPICFMVTVFIIIYSKRNK